MTRRRESARHQHQAPHRPHISSSRRHLVAISSLEVEMTLCSSSGSCPRCTPARPWPGAYDYLALRAATLQRNELLGARLRRAAGGPRPGEGTQYWHPDTGASPPLPRSTSTANPPTAPGSQWPCISTARVAAVARAVALLAAPRFCLTLPSLQRPSLQPGRPAVDEEEQGGVGRKRAAERKAERDTSSLGKGFDCL